jgi:hypothetical protein
MRCNRGVGLDTLVREIAMRSCRPIPLLLLAFLTLALAGCDVPPQVPRRAVPNTSSAPAKVSRSDIPPIDAQAPTQIETATFGLG